jgi:hypothetical protein
MLVRNRHGARMSGSELQRSHGAPTGTVVSQFTLGLYVSFRTSSAVRSRAYGSCVQL